MATDPPAVTPGPPKFNLGAYTSSELRERRRELEHAIQSLPDTAPIQADLRRSLADVEAEEQARARLAAANGRG
jgi:hypothetical protein